MERKSRYEHWYLLPFTFNLLTETVHNSNKNMSKKFKKRMKLIRQGVFAITH